MVSFFHNCHVVIGVAWRWERSWPGSGDQPPLGIAMPEAPFLSAGMTLRQAQEVYARACKGLSPSMAFALGARHSNGPDNRFWDRVVDAIGDTPVAHLTQSFADHWAQTLYPHAAAATRKRQFYNLINPVLAFCSRSGLCVTKPLVCPPVPKEQRTRCLEPNESVRIFDAAKPHMDLILAGALGIGATNSELVTLQWSQVKLDDRQVILRSRVAKLPIELVARLRRVEPKTGHVVRRPDGQPYAPKKHSAGQYKTSLRTVCRDAAVTDFCMSDLVITYAMWHLAIHQNYAKLAADSGWPDQIIRRYKRPSVITELPRLRDALFSSRPPIIPGGLPQHSIAPWGV